MRDDGPPTRVSCVGIALREGGRTLGYALRLRPGAAGQPAGAVVRGDEAQFGRMARLFEPRRTQAAILFADLDGSSVRLAPGVEPRVLRASCGR